MIKEPYIFKSISDAKEKLKNFHHDFKLELENEDFKTIIVASVSSNIFRALPTDADSPSELYRNWVSKNFDKLYKSLSKITSQATFDRLLFENANSLINHWSKSVGNPDYRIGFGPAVKLINLLVKRIQKSEVLRIKTLDKFLHVPFDKYSLLPLKNIINNLGIVPYKISIPVNVTMSYVTNKEFYDILHQSITSLCKTAGITRIEYDYWAWDKTHSKIKS